MLLRDLLEEPALRLRLLHGDEAALQRTVRWTYSSDLMDPGRYLQGGEIVISGLVWRRTEADSETFVSNVSRAGAAALAAGEANFGCIPQDVVDACRRHDLVLLAVPEDVSFSALNELVIGSDAVERGMRLESTLGRHRQMLSALADGRGLDELLEKVSLESGVACRVMNAAGHDVVPVAGSLSGRDRDRITQGFLTAARLPVVLSDHDAEADPRTSSGTYSVFPVGSALGSRLTMWSVVASGVEAEWPMASRDAVVELAAVAQLERSRIEERRRILRPIADDAMRLVATGATGQPETVVRMRQAGVDPDDALAVVVAGICDADSAEESRAVLEEVMDGFAGSVVAQAPDGQVSALVPCRGDAWAAELRTCFARLGPGLGRRRLCVGVSDPAQLTGLSGMWEEARHAQRLAVLGEGTVSVVTGTEITSHILLLAAVPDDVRRMFAARVLGPVLEYDTGHDARLLETLECFLQCSGSWNRAAQRLHLHVNSVRYRIARVEELTGRDLSRLEDRVDVFLALRSL